jgi:hypothetical protein
MFDNVVVGVDDYEAGRDALELAKQLVSIDGRPSRRRCSTPRRANSSATGAAPSSRSRALELAEADGMNLPFVLAPVRELVERHPRAPHRPRHPARGDPRPARRIGTPPARAARAAARGAQRRRVARRQIPAQQPQGARNRLRVDAVAEHGEDAPAPHLCQARCAQPQRGRSPGPASYGCSDPRLARAERARPASTPDGFGQLVGEFVRRGSVHAPDDVRLSVLPVDHGGVVLSDHLRRSGESAVARFE